jgi:hypothetical protein
MRLDETLANRSTSSSVQALADRLDRAIAVLRASAAPESPLLARLDALRERFAQNRLQLAALGQFKRGKSTFINALLGAPLLPIGVLPLTAVPTFIAWGPQPLVRVRFNDKHPVEQLTSDEPGSIREFLFRFVTEEANPENRLGVARVDLSYPAPLLADRGTVLIDTPGVGSTYRHNTEAALLAWVSTEQTGLTACHVLTPFLNPMRPFFVMRNCVSITSLPAVIWPSVTAISPERTTSRSIEAPRNSAIGALFWLTHSASGMRCGAVRAFG